MRTYFYKICFLLNVISLNAQENFSQDTLQARIQSVENSLSPLIYIEGDVLWNIEQQMHKYNIPGLSIAVINNYKIEWAKGYGTIKSTEKTPITTNTVFQAASVSKFVNAVALMKLKELKNINIDDDINTLLTSWKLPYNKKISTQFITLRQLLSHTSGLSTHGFNGYKNSNKLPSIVETLEGKRPANSRKVKPLFPPNKKFKYSGGGTTISQLILMDNTNSSYESFLNKNLFQLLGMKNSFYSIEFDKYPNDLAYAHIENGKPLKNNYNIYPESAAAGLWTTPSDLAELIIDIQLSLNNENGKILSNNSAKDLITPPLKDYNSALGLFVEKENGETYLQHSGSIKGYRSKFYWSQK